MSSKELVLATAAVAHAATPAVRTASYLARRLLSEPAKAGGDLIADQIRYLRWRNLMRIRHRAKKLIGTRKLRAELGPEEFWLQLLEAVGNVTNPDLQEVWARLLANAAIDASAAHPAHVEKLKLMTAREAHLLARISSYGDVYLLGRGEAEPSDGEAAAVLLMLGILEHPADRSSELLRISMDNGGGFSARAVYKVSAYGRSFLAAVAPDTSKKKNTGTKKSAA